MAKLRQFFVVVFFFHLFAVLSYLSSMQVIPFGVEGYNGTLTGISCLTTNLQNNIDVKYRRMRQKVLHRCKSWVYRHYILLNNRLFEKA